MEKNRELLIFESIKKRKWTMETFAAKIGLTRPTVYNRLENGDWRIEELKKVASVLELSIEALL